MIAAGTMNPAPVVSFRYFLLWALVAMSLHAGKSHAQTIEILGENISPRALSSDGSVVVGRGAEDQAIRWQNGEVTTISQLSTANDVSADGLVIVGSKGEVPGRQGYRWNDGTLTILSAPAGPNEILPLAVNQDGTVIGGRSINESSINPKDSQALKWQGLARTTLPGEKHAGIDDLDATGTIAVGLVSQSWSSKSKAALWQDSNLTEIGPGGTGTDKSSRAAGISADGTKVLINIRDPQATPWDTFQVYSVADQTKSQVYSGVATGISSDGSVIVGYNDLGLFILRPGIGLQQLETVLRDELQFDLEGWQLDSWFVAVSDDGKWLIGTGQSPDGKYVGWRLKLEPAELKIIVNSIADRPLDPETSRADTGWETDSGDPEVTLRSAIQAVNLGRGDRIEFGVPDVSIPSIALSSALPAITVPVEIDGTTQSGNKVEIRGNELNAIGLDIQGGSSTIQGLIVHGFEGKDAAGIRLATKGDNKVISNCIGVQTTGNGVSGNRIGILIENSSGNEIGSQDGAGRNIIHGLRAAVRISGANSENNSIVGNRIGIGNDGSILKPLALAGVDIHGGKKSTIGGSGTSGNSIAASIGVAIATSNNPVMDVTISGNRMGLDLGGTNSAEAFAGIAIFAAEQAPVDGVMVRSNKIAGSTVGVFAAAQGDFLKSLDIEDNEIGLTFNSSGTLPQGIGEGGYLYGIRLDGVSGASIRNNEVAGFTWNVLVSGALQFYVTEEVDADNDGVPESGGQLIFEDPQSSDLPDDDEPIATNIDVIGNTIGLNAAGEVPQGAKHSVGISVYSLAKKVKISNNTVAGHSVCEIWLKSGEDTELTGNKIGTKDGRVHGSKIGVLIEDAQKAVVGPGNIISRNESAGIRIEGTASGLQVKNNFIGTNSGGGLTWPNGVGVVIAQGETENPLLDNVIEFNTIARNTNSGVYYTNSYIDVKLLSNLIYRNGNSSLQAGIAYEANPFRPPNQLIVLESEADAMGKQTVAFLVSPPGEIADEGEEEPETIIEIFGNPFADETQGDTLLVSERVDPTKPFLKSFTVDSDSVYVTSNNYTMTLTRGDITSEFALPRLPGTLVFPKITVEPSESNEVILSWETPELENLFTIQETRTLEDGSEWIRRTNNLVQDDDRTETSLEVDGESQFFRLILNPDALGAP